LAHPCVGWRAKPCIVRACSEVPAEQVNRVYWEAKKKPEMLVEVDSIAALAQPQIANVRLPITRPISPSEQADTIFAGPTRERYDWHCAMVTEVASERGQAIIWPGCAYPEN
jgi:hypothetical protein